MKKRIALLLAFIMLLCCAGCSPAPTHPDLAPVMQKIQESLEFQKLRKAQRPQRPQKPQESQESQAPRDLPGLQDWHYVYTRENFPVLDGSTSTIPLAQTIASILLSEDLEQVADLVEFSRTTNSYMELINGGDYYGNADLLLAAEPPSHVLAEKRQKAFEWVMEPFAIDGLVFVVNQDNPVDSLTTEQVQKIYTGEITNWSEVGGDDVEIIPFQRNEDAGSQTMMKKLVMGSEPMMQAPLAYISDSMGGLMDAIRAYDHSAGAIGYSVYYYANDMRKAEGLKILQIDGVEPCADSFRDKSYPFTSPYYVVMKAGLPNTDSTPMLFHWILSGVGQWLVEYMGYVPVSTPKDPFSPDTIPSTVYCDWSYLRASYSETLTYERYWPEPQPELIPHDDYGLLIPFVGKEIIYSGMHEYRYGLATLDGKVVVEPNYDEVSIVHTTPYVYALRQSVADENLAEYYYDIAYAGRRLWSVAAQDGSWSLPLEYCLVVRISNVSILLVDKDGRLWLCDPDGNLTQCLPEKNARDFWGMDWQEKLSYEYYDYYDGVDKIIAELRAAGTYPEDANVTQDNAETPAASEKLEIRNEDDSIYGVYDTAKEDWVIPPANEYFYIVADPVTCEPYIIGREIIEDFFLSDDYKIYNANGEFLLESEVEPMPINGIFTQRDGEWSGLIDKDGNWIMRFPLQSNTD